MFRFVALTNERGYMTTIPATCSLLRNFCFSLLLSKHNSTILGNKFSFGHYSVVLLPHDINRLMCCGFLFCFVFMYLFIYLFIHSLYILVIAPSLLTSQIRPPSFSPSHSLFLRKEECRL